MTISFRRFPWTRTSQPSRLNAELQKRFDALDEQCSFQEALNAVRSAVGHDGAPVDAEFGPSDWQIIGDFLSTLSSLDRQAFILFKHSVSLDAIAQTLRVDRHVVARSLEQTYSGLSLALPRPSQAPDGDSSIA
jgi:hypothetical protein